MNYDANIHCVERVSFRKTHSGVKMTIHVLDSNMVREDTWAQDGATEYAEGRVEHEYVITMFNVKSFGRNAVMSNEEAADDLANLIKIAANTIVE